MERRQHLQVERPLCESSLFAVTYENFTNGRFRHPARFVRWRPDKTPAECTYDQVDIPPPIEFEQIFPVAAPCLAASWLQ